MFLDTDALHTKYGSGWKKDVVNQYLEFEEVPPSMDGRAAVLCWGSCLIYSYQGMRQSKGDNLP